MSDTEALIADWLIDATANTRQNYRRSVERFERWLGKDLLEASRSDIRRWIAHLSTEGLADDTVRNKKSAVVGFYRHLWVEGLISENPAVDIKAPKGESAPRLGLTADQARRLISKAYAHSRMAAALVWLMAGTGLRVAEVCRARIEDLAEDLLTVTVKGGHRQVKALSPEVLDAVMGVVGDRTSGPIVVDGEGLPVKPWQVQELIPLLGEQADITERVTPHILRHTAATLALEGVGAVCDSCGRMGSPIEDVSALLGHRSIETTLRYVRNRDVIGGTRQAAARLGRVLRGAA